MFIGCIKEVPIATGLLIDSKHSYGIYDVMTKDAYRGKGYGSEMFQLLNVSVGIFVLAMTK